jgi:hypothetical protein
MSVLTATARTALSVEEGLGKNTQAMANDNGHEDFPQNSLKRCHFAPFVRLSFLFDFLFISLCEPIWGI